MKNEKRRPHLTEDQRQEIEECLGKGMTFKAIARHIGKDPTTVSYEVKKHRAEYKNSYSTSTEPCPELLKAPYVCNGCPRKGYASCRHIRYVYRSHKAQAEYKTLLSEAREGIPLNKEQFYREDKIISEGIRKGQHIYHIMASNPEVKSSKSTVYRNFKKGYYSASPLELPRMVKFKERIIIKKDHVPSKIRKDRTYQDFLAYCEEHDLKSHFQMDTVIGREGGKVILTLTSVPADFIAGLLLENKTSAEAAKKFSAFKKAFRNQGVHFGEIAPVILTDNGGEFADVFSFENDENERELRIFFCDPMASWQKPQIEKEHTLLRDILPKGTSFDDLTQETLNLILSHVNSVKRNLFHGKSAYEMFTFMFSEEIAKLFGIVPIDASEVCQSPQLLKRLADNDKNKTK